MPVAGFALAQGMRPELFEDAIGMPFSRFLLSMDQMFDAQDVEKLWNVMDNTSMGPSASVIAATQFSLQGFYHGVLRGAAFAPTARKALEFICEFRSLISHRIELRLEETANFASFSFFDPTDLVVSGHCNQSGGAIQWQWLLDWVVGDIALHSVSFIHGRNGPAESYNDFFQCDVEFDCWADHSRLVFDREILDRPLRASDSVGFALARAQGRKLLEANPASADDPLTARIKKAIADNAADGVFEVGLAVQRANVSMRTAQRHAVREGFNLFDLIQQQRAKIASAWLTTEPERPIGDVAEHLGYSDDRAFRRAFKQWTGITPSQFKRLQQTPSRYEPKDPALPPTSSSSLRAAHPYD
ncbi:MAG: helix-turn-helix domain-containing protein [Pseudomonadota bacterium]